MAQVSIRGSKINHKRGFKHAEKLRRRTEAAARQVEYDGASLQEKLDRHNQLFPAPSGDRERQKLLARIELASKKKAVAKEKEPATSNVEDVKKDQDERLRKKELKASQRRYAKNK